MNKKTLLTVPALAALALGGPGMATVAAAAPQNSASHTARVANIRPASVSDGQLSDSDSVRRSNGKYAAGTAVYDRSTNKLKTSLHVTTPYLFVGARGTITTTVYANTPWGPYPLWTVSHGLTACGLWDPTCSSSPAETWTDTPSYWDAEKVQKNAAYVVVTVAVE